MSKDEFLEYLSNQENKTVILSLEGIITLKMEIQNVIINYNEDYILLENKNDSSSNIKFNLHQLMKISKQINEEVCKIVLEFDQLQSVIITIKEEVC